MYQQKKNWSAQYFYKGFTETQSNTKHK
jgi:hypothetical protein